MKPVTWDMVDARLKDWARLGLLEDTGMRRRGGNGMMLVMWRLSPRGRLVCGYQERFGITFKQALALVAKTTFG